MLFYEEAYRVSMSNINKLVYLKDSQQKYFFRKDEQQKQNLLRN